VPVVDNLALASDYGRNGSGAERSVAPNGRLATQFESSLASERCLRVAITTFTRQLNLPETLAMSVALMAPTTGMVFVTPFLAAASGCNVPLAFVVSLIGVLVIGFSFGRLGSLNDRVKPR
jgi:hypothetical protein